MYSFWCVVNIAPQQNSYIILCPYPTNYLQLCIGTIMVQDKVNNNSSFKAIELNIDEHLLHDVPNIKLNKMMFAIAE